jgi:hypothetical protein
MDQATEWRESDTFVVRVFRSPGGGLTGLVQHVRTGEKAPFQGLESLGAAMARMTLPPGHAAIAPGGQRLDPEGPGP